MSKIFSDFWPKNFKNLWKLTSACPQEQLVALNFFQKFWTVFDFLQKPLAWFSKISLRVQSKICGRNIFCYSSFLNFFRISSEKFFQTFGQKTSRTCQKYLLRVQRNNLWLEVFFSFESFRIFCRNLWHGSSKIYLSVQSKKCGKNSFFVFLFRLFSNFEQNIFRLSAEKLQKFVKTTFCVSTRTTCGFKIFIKFWTVLDFLQKPLAWFSKLYLRVQSKICGRNIFFILPVWLFSDFELKIFQTFGQKTSRICQNYLLRVQRNNLCLDFFLSFESFRIFCRDLWYGSQKSFYVSRVKFAEELFFFLPFWFCSDFERKNFQTFGQKTSRSCQN